ncbi:hypothetical protein J2T60_002328 [Natronospira proteinivora]|uniref:Uncharacterized protein n=1 Tax=Natronospira proteinivora TaxID=1807133 RepID=A0ABT1GD82_9GAMM|nr:hypothetical protein [Natronospira proteinivora]MCP1728328.1 hypothetical protein [Natronospira proteinivora]
MFFRSLDKEFKRQLSIGQGQAPMLPSQKDWDIEKPGVRGQVFAIELEAGKYEFYNWALSSGPTSARPESEFSIPFEIRPGQSTYVGGFSFVATGRMGLTITSANVKHRDKIERDLAIIMLNYPNIKTAQVWRGIEEGRSEEMLGGESVTQTLIFVPMVVP